MNTNSVIGMYFDSLLDKFNGHGSLLVVNAYLGYTFLQVKASNCKIAGDSWSGEVTTQTDPYPAPISETNKGQHWLRVAWQAPDQSNIKYHSFLVSNFTHSPVCMICSIYRVHLGLL